MPLHTRLPASLVSLAALVSVTHPCTARAQSTSLPPVRTLAAPTHVSAELVGRAPTALRLASGRVLLNDVLSRRLILFDSTLATFTIVADSASGAKVPYGVRPGGLIPFRGDSSLFIDPASLSMMVLDGDAELARVMAVPNPDQVGVLVGGGEFGTAGLDAKGRLVFRGQVPRMPNAGPDGKPLFGRTVGADTLAVVRYDLQARKLDTIAIYKVNPRAGFRSEMPGGGTFITMIENPLVLTDEWIILRDGTLAVFRGSDYHVDWFSSDGKRTSTPKIPFEWRRLDDSTKVAFVDSLRAVAKKRRADQAANRGNGPVSMGGGAPAGGGAPGAAGGTRPPAGAGGGAPSGSSIGGQGVPSFPVLPVEATIVQPSELPDYAPPFSIGTARQDFEGNIWIRTTFAVNGGPIYDVVNLKGALVDRVSLPSGRAIAGFGPGVVYLAVREGPGTRLEMVKIR